MSRRRVDSDEVDLGDDYVWRHGAEPFTGITVDTFDDGSPWGETEYRNGVPDGLARTYWRSGGLRIEVWNDYGIARRERSWHESGRLTEDVVRDGDGRVVRYDRYAENGRLLETRSDTDGTV